MTRKHAPMKRMLDTISLSLATTCVLVLVHAGLAADGAPFDPTSEALKYIADAKVGARDWPQWGGSPSRNNVPDATNIPITVG